MGKNWKTNAAGAAGLLSLVAKLFASEGKIDMNDIALATTSVGLLFAKDHNVTGGTKEQ